MVSLIIACLSLLMAWMSVYDAIHAEAEVSAQTLLNRDAYQKIEKEVRLLQMKVDNNRAALVIHGVDPDFKPEDAKHE